MYMNLSEYSISCDWCHAKINERCKDLDGKYYVDGLVHIIRKRKFFNFIRNEV